MFTDFGHFKVAICLFGSRNPGPPDHFPTKLKKPKQSSIGNYLVLGGMVGCFCWDFVLHISLGMG